MHRNKSPTKMWKPNYTKGTIVSKAKHRRQIEFYSFTHVPGTYQTKYKTSFQSG
jgi:hypothetical protein